MEEANGKTAFCLAITEKKAHKPGGCAGIFFQLFDWNRRFAKKKLFSKKLPPPARAKQPSKKFGGDEKMPKSKLHLIADENLGGFPNVKKIGNRTSLEIIEHKHEMRAPGLVARLMGLESLPTVHRDKHKKTSNLVTCEVREEKFVNNQNESDSEDLRSEEASTKAESRPQKLQKTGQYERRAVTRFGTEASQIRSVLSRSRKHHHPKLASPVKSPRMLSSRNASRLIDAATRILEPGLLATNRAKCSLTYSSSTSYAPKDAVLIEGARVMSPDVSHQQQSNASYNADASKSLMGQTSCKNCGNLFDVVESKPNMEGKPFVCPSSTLKLVNSSSQVSGRSKPMPHVLSPEQQRDVYQRNLHQPAIAPENQDNVQAQSEHSTEKSFVSQDGQAQRQLRNQQCRNVKDGSSSVGFRQRAQTQNETLLGSDRIPRRAKSSNLQSRRASLAANAISEDKDFVALNRSSGSCIRSRASTRLARTSSELERKFSSRQDSLAQLRSPVRKRTVGANSQIESTGFPNSVAMRQRNGNFGAVNGKELRFNACSTESTCIKNRSPSNITSGKKDDGVVSFTFSSPLKHKTFISSGMKEETDQIGKHIRYQRKLGFDENVGKTSLQKQLPLNGDTLGALLEQKLKELISQEDDEFRTGVIAPKRSTAMILQELISALTAEQHIPPDGEKCNAGTTFKTERKIGGTSTGFSISQDGNHLSPGSVLEASFSNESCFSSSLDDSSGCRLLPDFVDYSYDQPQAMETDADFLDSATSIDIDLADGGLTGSKLTYAKEVILNTELLFGDATSNNSNRKKGSVIGPFLLNELETLANAMWASSNLLDNFEESKEGSQIRRFLFDCVIEWLDSKYGRCGNSGFQAWSRLPSCMSAERLIREVQDEVRGWTRFVVMGLDEIAEWEMSHGLGKWTDFEIEAFETGAEIDWEILQILVEETAIELWECRLGS